MKQGSCRMASHIGTSIGLIIGCLIGMLPLFFMDPKKAEKAKKQAEQARRRRDARRTFSAEPPPR